MKGTIFVENFILFHFDKKYLQENINSIFMENNQNTVFQYGFSTLGGDAYVEGE